MKIQPCTENPVYPYILIDEFYDKEEEKLIWQELEFYSGKFLVENKDTTKGVSAADETGKSLNSSQRLYLDEVYGQKNRHISNILNVYGKILGKEIIKAVNDNMPTATILSNSNRDTSQISYYDSGDFYDAHVDLYGYSVMVWFFKKPKRFDGGDFVLSESDTLIECKHNRLIMIPSYYLHSVTPIKMEKKYKDKGLGRYTLTHFYFFRHQ